MVNDTLVAAVLSAYLLSAGDHAALFQGNIEPQIVYSTWMTHPYWGDDQFHDGAVNFDGLLYPNVKLRYNIYENMLVVLSPQGQIPVAPETSHIDYFILDGNRFEKVGDWYYCVCYEGTDVSLLMLRKKTKTSDVLKDNAYYHDLDIIEQYFVRDAKGNLYPVSSEKSLLTYFPAEKEKLRQYIKDNKISFKKSMRSSALKQCVRFLDSYQAVAMPKKNETPLQQEKNEQLAVQEAPVGYVSAPDSLFEGLSPVTRVPAYYFYSSDSYSDIAYGEDWEGGNTPGIQSIEVERESRTLEEVEVVGFSQKVTQSQSGMESFRPSLLKNVPQAMGEADVLKLATMLPGVSTTGEASSGLNVRGGGSDQNLLLYNGNTIFNPMHLFGIVSAFNPDLIAETELYKGGIPSQYGGRLSSVLIIKGRTADKQKFHGSASIGLITAKGVFDIPIVKDKVSLLIGGRTTYSDWMLKRLPEKSGYKDGTAGFWDLGGTLNAMLNARNSISINGYFSKDRFAFSEVQKYGYTNMDFSAEWKGRLTSELQSNVLAAYDHYDYYNDDTDSPTSAARLSFNLDQYTLRSSLTYQLNDDHSLMGGVQGQMYQLMPGKYEPIGVRSNIIGRQLKDDKAIESAAYVEDTWTINDAFKVNGGVRLNLFNGQKEGMEQTYFSPDIRLSGSWSINENQSVKTGFNTLHQYIHKVSNTVIMSPTDNWLLSNSEIKPQSGWQVSGGYYWRSEDMVYEFSAETYYKGMDNYLTYRSAAQLTMNEQLEKDVIGVEGRAYGLELQIRKLSGRFNGWLSYTYSRTQLRQGELANGGASLINDGEWFSADYDVPHTVKFSGNYKFTRRYSTSLNADYSTGRPFTGPVAEFYNASQNTIVPVYSERNGCRMPYYFRVDWSFNIEPSHHLTAKTHRWFTLGVYNLMGRRNAYSIYYESLGSSIQGYKLSIFGAPIPYITYNIKF